MQTYDVTEVVAEGANALGALVSDGWWRGQHGYLRDDGSMADSLNHYSKGAVISFLHRYTGGLQILQPGYRSFRVAPRPGGGITRVRTHHVSPHGRIEVAWSLTGRDGRLDLTVPDGTEAHLELPDHITATLGPGTHHLNWTHPPG